MRFETLDTTAEDRLSASWPVGAVYIAGDDVPPATKFGFGTWEEFAAGRMLIGRDAGQTAFDTINKTGGAKDVTLTADQSGLPQHTHAQDAHNHTQNAHSHVQTVNSTTTGGTSGYTPDVSTNNVVNSGYSTAQTTATNNPATATNQDAGPTNAAQAHENMPPFIVVRIWRRIA